MKILLTLLPTLTELYGLIFLCMGIGYGSSRFLPSTTGAWLAQGLFWVGTPLTAFSFIVTTPITGHSTLAPLLAWLGMGIGVSLAWLWLQRYPAHTRQEQGSFLLATMVGNTGFIGFPITWRLLGQEHFSWALFFDLMGTLLISYSAGIGVAASFGDRAISIAKLLWHIGRNPTLWCVGIGLLLRQHPLPAIAQQGLLTLGWLMVIAGLIYMGICLGEAPLKLRWERIIPCLTIKMLLVPLLLGLGLTLVGISGRPRLGMVLQAGMPPAFMTLILADVYHLDRAFAASVILTSLFALILLLPLWLVLFAG
ncbi:AEC family transporter [Thermosynechococcus sp. PP45]|uniref:AEC family transporter n=1 Tax=unclassified Thermosynechococcus TaxID=2622553 RepID=UPI0026726B38|nr:MULTISPECIES: AEC family transporter [unclassified Thermosynechococcus]WKT81986.1 AEC family transporter [Thermosynechococcus sp. PP45]WNC25600.1 AEC family transporter [Thermosynechococcus sp. PP551]WNC28179.1 AEC family transporter [Thermosynechococcus sp. PP555]